MHRVVVLGRGGAGKTAFARALGSVTGLPVVELDAQFWRPDLSHPTPPEWEAVQERLIRAPGWILDGDLGPYDVLTPRLRDADHIIVLNFALWRCVWRTWRRGRERADYWRWVFTYRRSHLPKVLGQIRSLNASAQLLVARRPADLEQVLAAQRG